MGLENTGRETYAATRDELEVFVKKADELGYPEFATAAMIGFEWLLREIDILERFFWSHYRPAERPDAVRINHHKNRKLIWMPLFFENEPLFPELICRLDNVPRYGINVVLTKGKRKGTVPRAYERAYFAQIFRTIRDKAGLPEDLTFTSFRHGGITELANADISDQGMMALSGHKTRQMLTIYAKRNEKQRVSAAVRRLLYRTAL